jgi:hypothetical protein
MWTRNGYAMMPTLDSLVREYNRLSCGLGMADGRSVEYREVRLERWPTLVHYEFVKRESSYQVEFHWQQDDIPGLTAVVDGLLDGARTIFEEFSPERTEAEVKKQRIVLYLPAGLSARDVAKVMHHFVAWSWLKVDRLVHSSTRG